MADKRSITTEAEYDAALARVSELMDVLTEPHGQIEDANHPARVELDGLVDLIEAYENEHYPMEQGTAGNLKSETGLMVTILDSERSEE